MELTVNFVKINRKTNKFEKVLRIIVKIKEIDLETIN